MVCPHCSHPNTDGALSCVKCGGQLPAAVATQMPKPRRPLVGIFLIAFPFLSLIVILSAYAITQFVINAVIADPASSVSVGQGLGQMDPRETMANVVRIVLGFLGTLSVLSFFVCIPLGIVFLRRKTTYSEGNYDARSGKGEQSVVPEEISGWNWGAAGLGWIWGVYHNVWISLLNWVPFVNLVFWIVLAIKGNEWAWRNNQWRSIEEFKAAQRKWTPWGIIFFVLWILIIVLSVFSS